MTERKFNDSLTIRKPVNLTPRFPSLLVHLTPVSEGISYDSWMFKQQLCTPRELEAYIVQCSKEKSDKAEQKAVKRHG